MRANLGATVDSSTFKYDLNTNGAIASSDVTLNKTVNGGSLFPDFAFTGYYYHARSGLYLTLYRAYNPTIGRWLSRDPIGERGGLNLYGYVSNNSLNRIDPYGLAWWEWVPVVSTLGHAGQRLFGNVPGLSVEDYASCANNENTDEAGMDCKNCIQAKLLQFQASYVGVATGADMMKFLAGGATGLVGRWATREGVDGAFGATVTGGILGVDGIVDFGIVFSTTLKMGDAAKEAQHRYCHCN